MTATSGPGPIVQRPLTCLAWLNVVTHVAGLALAGLFLRPGSPLVPLADRLAYLASRPAGWAVAWTVWLLCALALIAFLSVLAYRLDAPLSRLALSIAVVGAGFDVGCDTIYLAELPALAAGDAELFLAVERITGIASLVVANGSYSLGVLLMTLALRGRPELVRGTVPVGWGVAIFGLLLAAAGFTGVAWHAEWATPPTMGLFCVWVVLVARSLERPARPT